MNNLLPLSLGGGYSANDNCVDAITLPIVTECSPEGYTNRQATEEGAANVPAPSCTSYRCGDVCRKAVSLDFEPRVELSQES